MSDAFDRLTELAAALFQTPIALVTSLEADRQWFRSSRGYDEEQTTFDESFCRHMVGEAPGSVMVVEDATLDPRFVANGLVTEQGVRFYAGAIISTADGKQDGAVCVLDTVARDRPSSSQMECLKLLARLAGQEIDRSRETTTRRIAERVQAELIQTLGMAEELAKIGSWRLDAGTGAVQWSAEVYRIHGVDPETFDPALDDALAFYHPDDRGAVRDWCTRAIETGECGAFQFRLIRSDGEERLVVSQCRPERDETGATTALFGVFQDVTHAVRSQQELEHSEALYRLMSETSTDIIARYDGRGRFLYISPAVKTVLGRNPADMLGKDCAEFIPADDLKVIVSTLQAYVAAGADATPPRYEYRAIRADGSTVWLEATPRALRDASGQLVEFHDHIRDITERKEAERAQAELVETLKLAETVAGVGHWRLELATGKVKWSDQVYRIHGKSPETWDPSLDDAVNCYHPDDRDRVAAWVAGAIKTGESEELRLRLLRDDGEERIVTAQCLQERNGEGEVIAVFGVFTDITEQVRIHEAVAASEARYRLLADNATDVIITVGLDGRFQYISPAVIGPMGYRPDELVGRPFAEFMHPDDVPLLQGAFQALVRSEAGSASTRVAYRAIRKDGSQVWLEAHPTAVRSPSGRITGFQDVVRDITDRKALEAELIAARDVAEAAARAKSEFLANMSHELRTPLTSVIGFSGLLQGSMALPEAERRYADRIATSSEALLSVINDILDYSKLEADAVELEPLSFDPGAMVSAAAMILETQSQNKGLTLVVEVAADLPKALTGDEGRLRQVTLNFLSNAVKFTQKGEIRLTATMVAGGLRVAVKDAGIGIPADKIDQLFDRFTQVDASTTRVYGGTGLGLAISRRLIEMMGGRIGAESRPGEGSTFWFEVPLETAVEAGPVERASAAAIPAGTRILLADDTAANRELVTALLSGLGLQLDLVCNGTEAVEAAAAGTYDLILMDVQMPVMDGLDATRAIRALGGSHAETPIIALSANVQPEHIERCLAAGMDGHVGKPIQISDLLNTIAAQLSWRDVADGRAGVAA